MQVESRNRNIHALKDGILLIYTVMAAIWSVPAYTQGVHVIQKILPSIFMILTEDGENTTMTSSNWGAAPLTQADRADTTWVGNFSSGTTITITSMANGNTALGNALNQCDISDPAGYCNVHITTSLALTSSFYLGRSRTRIYGDVANKPVITSESEGAFIQVDSNTSEIIIEALEFDGQSVSRAETYGVVLDGSNINNVIIRNNFIHDFNAMTNAHGIAVYGRGTAESTAIQNIVIDQNVLKHMRTGSSESIVINGNVKNWEIINNNVSDVNNIAIDAIGGEGTSAPVNQAGRVLPSALDAARFGFIEGNTVSRMSTKSNSEYGNEHTYAAAIYIDGGRNILVANNDVNDAPWGYEIGAENCVVTRDITLDGNTSSGSWVGDNLFRFGDLLLGGYATTGYLDSTAIECDPGLTTDNNEGHGNVSHITIVNSTFSSQLPAQNINPVEIQLRLTNTVIVDLGVSEINATGDGSASGDSNAIRSSFP